MDLGLTVCSLVSLQQMVLFGQNPSQGTLLRASQFLLGTHLLINVLLDPNNHPPPTEELPVRLAHRVKELDELPHNLSAMPSINKVKDWYAQSFEVPHFVRSPHTSLTIYRHFSQELISFPAVKTSKDVQTALKLTSSASIHLPESVPNPSFNGGLGNPGNGKMRIPIEKRWVCCLDPCLCALGTRFCRYYAQTSGIVWPPEIRDYNAKFTRLLESIKRRHDPTVTTVAQGVLEWKRTHNARKIDNEIQAWLDRFYLSRIGIRFLLGQRTSKL